MSLFSTLFSKKKSGGTGRARQARPAVEALESRLTPYALTGNAWINPQVITISFVPDGTVLNGNGDTSNLFATMNARFGSAATWQNQFLKAAQSWAQQTNINFAVVADDGEAIGAGAYQQGNPNFGDIRIGGMDLGANYLAQAYQPPPANNTSYAGDVQLNTTATWSIGSGNDLYTVAVHEIGHALGLDHSTSSSSVMYASYTGVKNGLSSDDISGIDAVYNGARQKDGYSSGVLNGGVADSGFSTAANLTAQINTTSLTALVTGLDITTTATPNGSGGYTVTANTDYYTFTAPAGTSGTLALKVQSAGLSLLAPKVTVYAANQTTVLGSANGAGQYGTTLTVTLSGVTAGQQFYVKVQGADNTALGSGAYALTLNLGTGASPTVPLPNTTLANGLNPVIGGGCPLVLGTPDCLAVGVGGLKGLSNDLQSIVDRVEAVFTSWGLGYVTSQTAVQSLATALGLGAIQF